MLMTKIPNNLTIFTGAYVPVQQIKKHGVIKHIRKFELV